MARKDPPGVIYLGDGIQVSAHLNEERNVAIVKFTRWMPSGKKRGMQVRVTYEAINQYDVPEGGEHPRMTPDGGGIITGTPRTDE